MREVSIRLATSGQVQRFVKAITPLDGDFELIHGKFLLDARSLMGVFSLDLTQPITLKVYKDSLDNLEAIRPFLVSDGGDVV